MQGSDALRAPVSASYARELVRAFAKTRDERDALLKDTGIQQQVLDQPLHPGRLLLDATEDHLELHAIVLGPHPEELGEALDRREWRPQLVRQRIDKRTAKPLAFPGCLHARVGLDRQRAGHGNSHLGAHGRGNFL